MFLFLKSIKLSRLNFVHVKKDLKNVFQTYQMLKVRVKNKVKSNEQ